ncbi:MAG: UDP-3-O-[3-hydroxymyristoyl] N-acetylglucosamine deacetylase [Verrucomicrobia bacterium]|nr:UDP-3-O-[3-hydroxymyristoyl] N-acetylglucosamine deacetylase [Verrucomicrobiota bacterium]
MPGLKTQKTLKESVSADGIGVFTGEKVSIRICPAEKDAGIIFQRVDLPNKPILPAKLEFVQGTPRCTVIGDKGVSVQTVEHILAAFKAYGIDNALIEISGSEVPIFDGSSLRFVELIEEAGVAELENKKNVYFVDAPIFWSQGDIHIIALPSHEYRISYTLHYPHSQFIGSQFYSVVVDQEHFKKEIAPCRTFSIYEEIAPMIEKGLVKGGSLENAVIIKENAVANPEGLRFSDEMVRHKVLDLIGDLSLVPVPFLAHIIAIRSGHASNNAFAKELFNHIKMENS